ncbi:Protein-lysine N-methyltransferase efm4 [Coemansia erecta]|nr:Protein-lysine N-methyltransferase efm4 [Coemansia sp. RSA 2618]KAJ2820253.1 Protein-lysine N-methyltransferase efm4 [Coemansia erecta]
MSSKPDTQDTSSFNASRLGRKDHWNSVYDLELTNFNASGDIGEVWFGESAAAKMVTWVCKNIDNPDARIIDIGCGNGHLLLELASEGFTQLTGTDYSEQAVELARSIAQKRPEYADRVTFVVQDFLDSRDVDRVVEGGKFDVVLDKGTYDAICLMPSNESSDGGVDQRAIDVYPQSVVRSLSDDGVFLITSCNWTEDELVARFAQYLQCIGRVKHGSFMFGGSVGQTVATVAFKKKHTTV